MAQEKHSLRETQASESGWGKVICLPKGEEGKGSLGFTGSRSSTPAEVEVPSAASAGPPWTPCA